MPHTTRTLALVVALTFGLAGLAGVGYPPPRPARGAPGTPAAGDWPMYLAGPTRQGWNPDETALSPATAPHLRLKWAAPIGAALVPSPAVAGDTIYEGSWDGYEYAINVADGSVRWKTFLGTTGTPHRQCKPNAAGITSSAAVGQGLVYVGGGADDFYALDAATGQPAWNLFTGQSGAVGGHYNWASPALAGGRVFSGIASFCDRPFVRGYMWSADAATGHDEQRAYTVLTTSLGGGIWTSPTIDLAHNRAFLTTGSPGKAPGFVDSVVTVDLATSTILDAWRPLGSEVKDPDWGTTPTLMTLPGGKQLIGAGNKNGIYYVFDADHLHAGPIWQYQAGQGGECPQCGEGVLASAAYHDGVLYVAAGFTEVDGTRFGGSVRAFDAATGTLRWAHYTAGPVLASLAGANGVIVAVGDNQVHVIDAATGATLFRADTKATVYGAPVIAHGVIYVPALDGVLYAYEVPPELVPPSPTPSPAATATPTPIPPPAALSP